MSAVHDASVVVKWFIEDPLSDAAILARRRWGTGAAPSHLLVEAANVFRRYVVRGEIELALALDNLDFISRAVRTIDQRTLIGEATSLGARFNHSVQDCLYVVLAIRDGVPLITADGKLARKFDGLAGLRLELLSSEDPDGS